MYDTEYQYELPNVIDMRKENWELKIIPDGYCENPRTDCDGWIGEFLVPEGCRYVRNECEDANAVEFYNYDADKKALEKLGYIVFPVSVYDHSGVNMFIGRGRGFDCGCIGFYVVNKKKYREERQIGRITKDRMVSIVEQVKNEIKYYSDWLEGECYRYVLYRNGEKVDSCGGFVNEFPEVVEDMYFNFPNGFRNAFSIEEAKEMAVLTEN